MNLETAVIILWFIFGIVGSLLINSWSRQRFGYLTVLDIVMGFILMIFGPFGFITGICLILDFSLIDLLDKKVFKTKKYKETKYL
jgi:hypothetical protein